MIPDYRNYSIEELTETIKCIDKETYPERYDLLKNCIANYIAPRHVIEKETFIRLKKEKKTQQFYDYRNFLEERIKIAYIISFLVGISHFFYYIFYPFYIFGFSVNFNIPYLEIISSNTLVNHLIYIFIFCSFIISGLSYKIKFLNISKLTFIPWLLLSINFKFGTFFWHTSQAFEIRYSFEYNYEGTIMSLGINFISLVMFQWFFITYLKQKSV